MEATPSGYATKNSSYETYLNAIMSITHNKALLASMELGFPLLYTDWRKFYESGDDDDDYEQVKGDWRMKLHDTCKEIYSGSWYEFKDFENEYFYRLNEETAKTMKDAGGPSLGLIHSEGHVGGILLTQAGKIAEFNALMLTSPRVQEIVKTLSDGTVPKMFNIKDLQTNRHSNNDGCQTLVFMFAAPFLAGAETPVEKLRAMERAMNYNEYILDGLALFAKAVVGVKYMPPPEEGFDRRVLSDVVTKVYPSMLRSPIA